MTIAVSTWALHRLIGTAYWNSPEEDVFLAKSHLSGSDLKGTDIRELASEVKAHGYDRLELCHFHLSSRDPSYLEEVKSSFLNAGLTLQTLLIDAGDLTHPIHGDRDCDWIANWIEAGQELGAEAARVIAGKEIWSEESFGASSARLKSLRALGLHLRIENWFDLLKTPEHVHRLLDRLEGQVGLCVDFGNWAQPGKHADLEAIAGRAETSHAKAEFLNPTEIDREDYEGCLNACVKSGFSGPFVLVNGGCLPTEWEALEIQRGFIQERIPVLLSAIRQEPPIAPAITREP